MRDEWMNGSSQSRGSGFAGSSGMATSRSSQGLTRVGRQQREMPSLTLSSMAMKLKSRAGSSGGDFGKGREVSARRQVGDAESMVNPVTPWWRNVGMEEGI
jgi:hypothetical protein